MGHENGGWMNSDQRDAMKSACQRTEDRHYAGTAVPLECANCGEVSTNPGQFMVDGRWVCTEKCRKELYSL